MSCVSIFRKGRQGWASVWAADGTLMGSVALQYNHTKKLYTSEVHIITNIGCWEDQTLGGNKIVWMYFNDWITFQQLNSQEKFYCSWVGRVQDPNIMTE